MVDLAGERISSRAFTDDTVDVRVQREMLLAASRTASWCNTQPWQVFVVSGSALSRLSDALTSVAANEDARPDFELPSAYTGAYAARRRAAGFALYESLGIRRDDRVARRDQLMKNYRFFGAPHTAIVTTARDLGVFGAVDCGAYIANLLRSAHENGVQTVPQAAIALYPDVVRDVLEVSADRLVVCAVSFGYADASAPENHLRTERAAVDESVTFVG